MVMSAVVARVVSGRRARLGEGHTGPCTRLMNPNTTAIAARSKPLPGVRMATI